MGDGVAERGVYLTYSTPGTVRYQLILDVHFSHLIVAYLELDYRIWASTFFKKRHNFYGKRMSPFGLPFQNGLSVMGDADEERCCRIKTHTHRASLTRE